MEINDPLSETIAPKFIMDCSVYSQWVEFKGETYFATLNYERSINAHRCMIDLHYCATKALNGIVLKTVRYDKRKFKKSHLDIHR